MRNSNLKDKIKAIASEKEISSERKDIIILNEDVLKNLQGGHLDQVCTANYCLGYTMPGSCDHNYCWFY